MKVRKIPHILDAYQWFKNGDHPHDRCDMLRINGRDVLNDGSVVRRYYGVWGEHIGQCLVCGTAYNDHGKVHTPSGEQTVCPGDWIITGLEGEYYPLKPAVFAMLYESVKD